MLALRRSVKARHCKKTLQVPSSPPGKPLAIFSWHASCVHWDRGLAPPSMGLRERTMKNIRLRTGTAIAAIAAYARTRQRCALAVAAITSLLMVGIHTASADVIFTLGNNPQPNEEN